jgi:hypothetical protein
MARAAFPFYAWCLFAAAAALLTKFSAIAIRYLLGSNGHPYKVLGSFWISGWAAAHHLDPYAIYPLTWKFQQTGVLINDINLSPPCMLPVFELLSRLTIPAAIKIWTFASLLQFLGGVGLILVALKGKIQKRKILWLILSSSVLMTLWLGQDYSMAFFLACLVWLLFQSNRMDASAIVVGIIVAMKPNFGFWPVMLFLAGHRRAAAISTSTAIVLSALPILIYGPSVYLQWLHTAALPVPHFIFPSDISLVGLFSRMGFHTTGIIGAVLVALALLFYVWRARPTQIETAVIAICAGILCAPLAWYYYILIAAPFFATSKSWGWYETLTAVLLALPSLGPVPDPIPNSLRSLPQLLGLALLLKSFMRNGSRSVSNCTAMPFR